ncbi:MAG: hypothetical protein II793_00630 [Bacteroidales bacterium]|nr:hypothetical protein [Bacteroidales bacterium]
MKKISLFLVAFAALATVCFTSCTKDETEQTDNGTVAVLNDFVGTYNVTITAGNLLGSVDYHATLDISAAEAELLGVTLFESSHIAQFHFTTEDNDLRAQDWYPMLNQTYGYVKDGYMIMACNDTVSGKTIIYGEKMPYKRVEPINWRAYYAVSTAKWAELVSALLNDYVSISFSAVRRND